MKKALTVFLVALLSLVSLFAQGAAEAASSSKTEIIVFAAASMTETLNTIKTMYEMLTQTLLLHTTLIQVEL